MYFKYYSIDAIIKVRNKNKNNILTFPQQTRRRTHSNTSPFVPGRMTIKRPAALLDPWPLIPGGLPLPVLELEEGWRGDKRRACGGALTAPSVSPAQAASWVSSPSSVHWPLSWVSTFYLYQNMLSFKCWHLLRLWAEICGKKEGLVFLPCATGAYRMPHCASQIGEAQGLDAIFPREYIHF